MAIAENSTHIFVGNDIVDHGRTMQARWIDIIDSQAPKQEEPEDTRSATEIAQAMWEKIRGN